MYPEARRPEGRRPNKTTKQRPRARLDRHDEDGQEEEERREKGKRAPGRKWGPRGHLKPAELGTVSERLQCHLMTPGSVPAGTTGGERKEEEREETAGNSSPNDNAAIKLTDWTKEESAARWRRHECKTSKHETRRCEMARPRMQVKEIWKH